MSIRQLLILASMVCAMFQAQAQSQAPYVTTPAAALTAGPAISLSQALQAAQDNIDVALARHSVNAAQADIVSANRSPFPTLTAKLGQMDAQNGIGEGNFFAEKRVDKSIGLDWTWERGNKRELRTVTAQRIATATLADLEDIRTQQQLFTLSSFYDLLAAQERQEHILQIERSASELARSAEKRVQVGDLAAQDGARTEIEAQRAASDSQLAELDRQRAMLNLWQVMGLTTPSSQVKAQSGWPELNGQNQVRDDLDALVDARADVRAAQARVLAAQSALDGSSAQKHSDITWGASYDHYPGTSTALIELRMQMPLQWGYSYQGEIGRAAAIYAQAQDALEKLRRQARAELQRLQHEALSTAQRAQAYEKEILPRAQKVAQGAELAYAKGAMPLTDLLDARRTLRATLLDAVAARADHARAAGIWQLRTQVPSTGAATLSSAK